MAKRSPAIAARNDQIYAMFRRGDSLTSLADQFGISPQRVGQVVAAFHPEGDEDDDRALYRGCLWRLYDEVQGLIAQPGWKMAPTGAPARGPDGEPAIDVMAKLEAAKLQLGVLESMRKLDSRDRQPKKVLNVEFSVAQQAAIADIERRRREMVQGEVIREIEPPAQPEP